MTDEEIRKDLNPWNLNCEEDEAHMAKALYLLQKAIALRDQEECRWPQIHACLRDAAMHCEHARSFWTKEKMDESKRINKLLFGGDETGH